MPEWHPQRKNIFLSFTSRGLPESYVGTGMCLRGTLTELREVGKRAHPTCKRSCRVNLTIWRKISEKKYLESTCCQINMIRIPIERSHQRLSLGQKMLQIGQVPAKLCVKTWSPKSGLRQGPYGKSLTHLAH